MSTCLFKCCKGINPLLTTFAQKKHWVLSIGLVFLVTLSLMLFATLTKDICYMGFRIRGYGLLVLILCLLLLIICVALQLNFIMTENASRIYILSIIIFVLWLGNVAGLIVAAISYAKSTEEETKKPKNQFIKTSAFILVELLWLAFIVVMFKYYFIIKENKEKPEAFEEQ